MSEEKPAKHRSSSNKTRLRRPPGRRSFTGPWNYLLIIGLLLIVALGGGTTLWAKGLILFVAGVWALLNPPETTPNRRFDWMILLFGAWSLTAFLPYGILGRAEWRNKLQGAGLDLSWMATPQPWVTAEALLMLLGGIVWFFLLWNMRIGHDDRRRILWVFTLGATMLGIGQIAATLYDFRSPFQAPGLGFSYFPNKNQTGLFFAMGGTCAFGLCIHSLRVKRRSAIIAAIALLLCFLAVVFSMSRAALLLFFLGCLVAYLTAFSLRGAFRALRFVLPIIIVGMTILLVMGRESLQRFSIWSEGIAGIMQDLRVDIYRDTLALATSEPISGLTMGNFEAVFPQYRNHVDVAERVIHPESDWLWVLAEMGLPAFAFLALAVVALLTRFIPFTPLREDYSQNYRAPALGAVIIIMVHSLIDVPAHRFGTLLTAFLLYRLAVGPMAKEDYTVLPPWVYRVFGGLLVIGGGAWLMSSLFDATWTTRQTQEKAQIVLDQSFNAEAKQRVQASLDSALFAQPLNWQNYTARARYNLVYQSDAKAAAQDFSLARLLEPTSAYVPFQEGVIWMKYSPRKAGEAWREALNRNIYVPESLYRVMLDIGSRNAQFSRELTNLSILDPELRYRFLMRRRNDSFEEAIYYEQLQDPELKKFTEKQRINLLEHWANNSKGASLRNHLKEYPNLTEYPWYYSGISLAAQKRYEDAIKAVEPYVTIAQFPQFTQFTMATDNELRQSFMHNPKDIVRGSVLLERQVRAEDWQGARYTADALCENEQVPDYAYYWKGELARRTGLSKEAWDAWLPYMKSLTEKRQKQTLGLELMD